MKTVHPSSAVQNAIVRLADELCTWERSTGQRSILIVRDDRDFVFRAMDGKPDIPDDIEDADLLAVLEDVDTPTQAEGKEQPTDG